MEAREKRLLKEILYVREDLVIPVYQRNYDWTKENCKRLFDDIVCIMKCDDKKHFFGSIVSVEENYNMIIIDGQQRITTVNLLLIAIYKYLESNKKNGRLKQEILESYLINRFKEYNKLKLKVSKSNRDDFESLFSDEINVIRNNHTKSYSKIYGNFLYFYDRIQNEYSNEIENLVNGIERLLVVDILLKHDSNPQLIFETLNSTGKDLEQADLIRNWLLMNLDTKLQEKIFVNYWEKMENNVNNCSVFLSHFLKFKTASTNIKDDEIYVAFKKYFNDSNKETIAKELLKYSIHYKQILDYTLYNDLHIKYRLENLLSGDFLEYHVIIPFLFYLITEIENKKLNLKEFKNILDILESYLFRRYVVGEKTAGLQKMFIPLAKKSSELMKKYNITFADGVLYILNQNKNPNDTLFKERFINFEFYKNKKSSSEIVHLLIEIENYNNKEKIIDAGNLTIEHVVPQTINKEWEGYLGNGLEIIQNEYLHTIGNLTITGYNPQLSNNSFDKKKKIYKNSKIKIIEELASIDKFTLEKIKERAGNFSEIASKIWKYYSSSLTINVSNGQETEVNLDDDFDFTHHKPVRIIFNDTLNNGCKNWRQVYLFIFKNIYEIDKNLKNININNIISVEKDKLRTPIEIRDNLYFEGNVSVNHGIENIKKIVKKLNNNEIKNISFIVS
jgi:uncharacterized protein with ParB-like and HNH nuclease domain